MKTEITEVNIMPVRPNNGLVAMSSFVLDEKVYVGSIAIYTKRGGGYRLSYPIKKIGTNRWDIFRPINKDVGKEIEDAILAKYDELITEGVTEIVPDDEDEVEEEVEK